MNENQFEKLLEVVCNRLTSDVRRSKAYHKPADFESRAREQVFACLAEFGMDAPKDKIDQGFPDIVVGQFGAEVKATESDSWRCIANSVSEGNRAQSVEKIYIIYGKLGGTPEVKWADYGKSIIHVRTSHVPRFEIEIDSTRSLFQQIGTTYEEFRRKPMHEKMPYIRNYAKSRLAPGERLWWLEDRDIDDQKHSLPLATKIYMDLSQEDKRKLRAETALLCPAIVSPSRTKGKYNDAAHYVVTYRGILCPQLRDLFSAGSVAGKELGGNYVQRALVDIQDEMREAARNLEEPLFQEYWSEVPARRDILLQWLARADRLAATWKPSTCLFLEEQKPK